MARTFTAVPACPLVLPLFVILIGCGLVSSDEVARIASPDKSIDAVLVETNGGATTSFGYDVYAVPKNSALWRGERVASLYGAVRSNSAYGVNLRWETADRLAIEYLSARQQSLIKDSAVVNGRMIRVSLKSGVVDLNAPAGGMLYNLQNGSGQSRGRR